MVVGGGVYRPREEEEEEERIQYASVRKSKGRVERQHAGAEGADETR